MNTNGEDLKSRFEAQINPERRDVIMRYLGLKGYVQDGLVKPDIMQRWLNDPTRCEGVVLKWSNEQERSRRLAEEKRQREEERKWDKFMDVLPAEFEGNLSVERSPRPKQFKFLSTFFSDPNSPWHGEFTDSKHGFVLTGGSGLGKTATAFAHLEDAIRTGTFREFEFIRTTAFFRVVKLKHMSAESMEEFNEEFESVRDTPLLVLDDLGSEVISPGAQETAFELIDYRTEEHLWTIITSNLSMSELVEHFGRNGTKVVRRLQQFLALVDFEKA